MSAVDPGIITDHRLTLMMPKFATPGYTNYYLSCSFLRDGSLFNCGGGQVQWRAIILSVPIQKKLLLPIKMCYFRAAPLSMILVGCMDCGEMYNICEMTNVRCFPSLEIMNSPHRDVSASNYRTYDTN